MIERGPSPSLGTGLGAAWSPLRLALELGGLGLEASSRGLEELARRLSDAAALREPELADLTRADLERVLILDGCAPSTARRYGEIGVQQFAAGGTGPAVAVAFLTRVMADADARAAAAPGRGRHDPQHRGLLRVVICALRRLLEPSGERPLTGMLRLPPRPPPVEPAEAATVTALRQTAREGREQLLLILACDLGLRPGQMAGLRRRDFGLRQGRVRLRGRRRTELRPFDAAAVRQLEALLAGLGPRALLFPSPRSPAGGGAGEPAPGSGGAGGPAEAAAVAADDRPLTVRALQAALKNLVRRAGVPLETTFTALRRAGAEARRLRAAAPADGVPVATPPGAPPVPVPVSGAASGAVRAGIAAGALPSPLPAETADAAPTRAAAAPVPSSRPGAAALPERPARAPAPVGAETPVAAPGIPDRPQPVFPSRPAAAQSSPADLTARA